MKERCTLIQVTNDGYTDKETQKVIERYRAKLLMAVVGRDGQANGYDAVEVRVLPACVKDLPSLEHGPVAVECEVRPVMFGEVKTSARTGKAYGTTAIDLVLCGVKKAA